MRLSIDHRIDGRFPGQAPHAPQYLRLTPRDDFGQRTLRWRIDAPGEVVAWRDGFGNVVHTLTGLPDSDALPIHVHGEVETVETHGIVPADGDTIPPEAFLRATAATTPDEAIRDYAHHWDGLLARGQLPVLHALTADIHERVAILAHDTPERADAASTLAEASGTSGDLAQLFIACCRTLAIPARFVSGYLHHTPFDLAEANATHCWAEALVDYLGWVSFDPANRQSATPAYVRLAVGFDRLDAQPLRDAGQAFRMRGTGLSIHAAHMAQQ